jgi:hypothetical protein
LLAKEEAYKSGCDKDAGKILIKKLQENKGLLLKIKDLASNLNNEKILNTIIMISETHSVKIMNIKHIIDFIYTVPGIKDLIKDKEMFSIIENKYLQVKTNNNFIVGDNRYLNKDIKETIVEDNLLTNLDKILSSDLIINTMDQVKIIKNTSEEFSKDISINSKLQFIKKIKTELEEVSDLLKVIFELYRFLKTL